MKLIHLQHYFRSTLPLAKNVTLAKNVKLSHADLNSLTLAPSYKRGNKPQIGSPLAQGEELGVRAKKTSNNYLPMTQIMEAMTEIWSEWRRQKLPLYLFLGLCLNLVLAPAVLAATGGDFSRTQAYWLAMLGLVTVALAIYLFFVMFVPEKF